MQTDAKHKPYTIQTDTTITQFCACSLLSTHQHLVQRNSLRMLRHQVLVHFSYGFWYETCFIFINLEEHRIPIKTLIPTLHSFCDLLPRHLTLITCSSHARCSVNLDEKQFWLDISSLTPFRSRDLFTHQHLVQRNNSSTFGHQVRVQRSNGLL